MGQLSDPYEQGENDEIDLLISGLPEDPKDPDPDEDLPVQDDVVDDATSGPDGDVDDTNDVVEDPTGDDADDIQDERDEDDLEDDVEDFDPDDEERGVERAESGEASDSAEEVAYDLSEWEDDQLDVLFDRLDEEMVAYLWDGDELFVQAADELLVDNLLERVTHPHELAVDDEDGDGGGWLLGELFVAADRLLHDPEEHESIAALLQLANLADEADPPYGLNEAEWNGLRERVTALATPLEEDKPDLDVVLEAAGELRNAVRPYV